MLGGSAFDDGSYAIRPGLLRLPHLSHAHLHPRATFGLPAWTMFALDQPAPASIVRMLPKVTA
jgi:hypothetical protein